MSHKFMTFLIFIFILGNLGAHVIEKTYFAEDDRQQLNTALAFNEVESNAVSTFRVPNTVPAWWSTFWGAIRWDYPFLSGEWELVKWLILWPISFGAVSMVLYMMSSAVFSLFKP